MLPKRLEVQAFGPYVKKQQIDFTQFMKDRLFLLEGETGSGKTMLLDAMTYALYGKSSGGPVSYTHLDVYKRQAIYRSLLLSS